MPRSELMERAIEAIGGGQCEDYILRPISHVQAIEHQAPALARLLRSSRITTLAQQYERQFEGAQLAKNRFQTNVRRANCAMLAVGILSPLIMVAGILGPQMADVFTERALLALGIISLFVAALATMWLSRVRDGSLLHQWMSWEVDAESTRITYFETLVGLEDSSHSELPLGLLKLEYFRRYQLDAQLAYCRHFYQQHLAAADKKLTYGGMAAGSAAFASGAAALIASLDALWAWLAAFGVMATAWSAFLSRDEAIYQDRRNADRLRRTLFQLENLSMRLDDIREGVATGPSANLQDFVTAVHRQIALAHQEWLTGAESTGEAVGKMDETLAALQRRGADKE